MTLSMFPSAWPDSPKAALWSFDKAIAELGAPATSQDAERSRSGLLRALLVFGRRAAPTEGRPDNEVLALFREETAPLRDQLAVCVLRLLPLPVMSDLYEPPWRPLIAKLIHSSLPDLGGPNINPQAHEYLVSLRKQVHSAETKLASAISQLTSLERIGTHRQELLSALNSKQTRDILLPFLPEGILPALGEAHVRAASYVADRDDASALESHRLAIEAIAELTKLLMSVPTVASAALLAGVARRLEDLIHADFARNKAVQPASVQIVGATKTYPLHIPSHTISVPFIVKNEGPGYAQDVRVLLVADNNASIATAEVEIGGLRGQVAQNFDARITVSQPSATLQVLAHVAWTNFDGSAQEKETTIVLRNQRTDVDWEHARSVEPYSLEPVDSEVSLFGRRDLLARMAALATPSTVGSAIVLGQKRVGKTSLAKALRSRLESLGHIVLYLESGDYIDPSPSTTVRNLSARISRLLKQKDARLVSLGSPDVSMALAPLGDYLEDVLSIVSPKNLIIVLDEFDELPAGLFAREAEGDAFFLSLRSISSRAPIGWILVGSEKMSSILESQGIKLNKWSVIGVDYFDRQTDWADYRELVKAPAASVLEFSDSAIDRLYEATAGNPYFTNILCRLSYRDAVNRQDCDVSESDINRAIDSSVREMERNAFQHFWEDGIIETGAVAAERSIRRRRILIALADTIRTASQKTSSLVDHPLVRDLAPIQPDLKEFERRGVLELDATAESYQFKVPLFAAWLKERGIRDIIATFDKEDGELSARRREEEVRVKPKELQELVARWSNYRGQHISEVRVQAWLEQFGSGHNQRLMFNVLRNLHFFSHQVIRGKLAEAHEIVRRTLKDRIGGRVPRSDEIVVTYLDGPAKSGAAFARLYTDEAQLSPNTVVERAALADKLSGSGSDGIRAVVVLDDFVGTGNSAARGIRELHANIGEPAMARDIRIIFIAAVAFVPGWKVVADLAEELKFGLHVYCCEYLEASAQVFGESSAAFSDKSERAAAMKLAEERGRELEKHCPLGYGNLQLAVVFERGCPNNTLPILWSESTRARWVPLFKRL